ncbi:aldehyde dehydrogenase family protein, partial [Neorhizobium galegae]|uniref:aldehyde dehydrogenase family protein n=1 Tax=Neorhizobium galegae TaxID=399 RepID=UPI0021044064
RNDVRLQTSRAKDAEARLTQEEHRVQRLEDKLAKEIADRADRVRTGSVTVNGMIVDIHHPFGGFKQSGIGREGGPEGLENYFEVKTIHMA